MPRAACLLLALLAAVHAADPTPIPRDALPAKLDLAHNPPPLDAKRTVPADNPLTDAKMELGRALFFDPILSADRSVACASCHAPERGFADPRPLAIGIRGQKGRRNAPSLLNRAYGT